MANGGQIWGWSRQKGAFRAVASQKKICLLEHQNAFAAIQSTFFSDIFVTILLDFIRLLVTLHARCTLQLC